MVFYMGLYTETRKIWHKSTPSDKTWENFRNLLADDYHNLCEIQSINTTQSGFNGATMAITMQEYITETLYNPYMDTTAENIFYTI